MVVFTVLVKQKFVTSGISLPQKLAKAKCSKSSSTRSRTEETTGGKVFDVLGEAFDNVSLKDLLVDAIRYGESPETKAKMNEVIDGVLDADHLKKSFDATLW